MWDPVKEKWDYIRDWEEHPVNNAAVRSEDCTLAIMSAAATPLPEASPTTNPRR
jgi:hypothetical protein